MPGKYFPKWRTILRWVLVLVVIGLAAQAGRLLHLQIKARAVRVRGPIPYTVTVRNIIHAPDGTTRVGLELTQAVRSDGSIAYRSSTSKSSGRGLYFSSGLEVSTDEVHNAKTSMMNANPNPAGSLRDPNSKCLNSLAGKPFTSPPETLLGEETLAGYRTVKVASDIITKWYALDYGCALVKDRWDFGPTEFTEKELVALVGGEPDATLFDVPANYREVPPSESIWGPKKERRFCNQDAEKFLQMMDEDYKRRAVKPQ